jgi:Alpha/beta hydrolase domain
VRWTQGGAAPPPADRIQLASVGNPSIAVRDAYGNALGGIRLAEHAVPTATNTGVNSGSSFCALYGTHIPFSAQLLAQLYRNHGAYVSAVAHVTNDNVAAGYLLPQDAEETMTDAGESDFGKH